MKVWIDQDLCTGDGICEEICPDLFFGYDTGLWHVKEADDPTGLDADGKPKLSMSEGLATVPDHLLNDAIDAAEECPGLAFSSRDDLTSQRECLWNPWPQRQWNPPQGRLYPD